MCNLCHENVREFYFSLNTAVWEVDLHNWNKWNKTKKYPPLCLMQKVLWWPKAVQNRTVIWDLRNKQENAKRWMSFLLICIIFLLFFCFVLFSNSQCCRCSLSMVVSEKLLPSLSLGRAIRISHSCQCPFWDHGAGGCLLGGTNLRFKTQWEAQHRVQPGRCKVWGSCASCPQLRTLPATISFNHCSWHGNPVVVQYKPRAGRQGT